MKVFFATLFGSLLGLLLAAFLCMTFWVYCPWINPAAKPLFPAAKVGCVEGCEDCCGGCNCKK